jgi:hypothetical protein
MSWTVLFQDDFHAEFATFAEDVQAELLAMARHLEAFGPEAKRPQVDTLKGSSISNMKEFRFYTAGGGAWRVAFAFDAKRRGIVLAAADKAGVSESSFYKRLIAKAEKRMAAYEAAQKEAEKREAERRAAEKKTKKGKLGKRK